MSQTIVLLTGFEPFESEPINASWEAARALDGETIGDARVVARCLPCVFGAAAQALIGHIETHRPALVLATGVAGGRAEISLERVAINVDDARIPDNAGREPIDQPIAVGGPAAYFSTLPIKRIVHALREAGIPAAVSQSAGTFVCNHVFYALMHYLAQQEDAPRGGFIHVPCLPQQYAGKAGLPTMTVEILRAGYRVAIAESLEPGPDRREGGGALN